VKRITSWWVDDSAVMRQVTAAVLSRDADIAVVPAADPIIALEKIARGAARRDPARSGDAAHGRAHLLAAESCATIRCRW